MADTPKDDDAFEDADFEDLDPIEDDDLGDDSWDEDDSPATAAVDAADDAGADEAPGRIKQKSFVQKNFVLIVGAVVVVFGGVIGMSLMGGGKSATAPTAPEDEVAAVPDASATPGVTELSGDDQMPPMPAPINGGEGTQQPAANDAAPDALTPMPTPQDMQKTELAELNVEEVPAAPAGKAVKEGEAPFDFKPDEAAPAPVAETDSSPQESPAAPVPVTDEDGNGKINAADKMDARFKAASETLPSGNSAVADTAAIAAANDGNNALPAPTLTDTPAAAPPAAALPDLTPKLNEQQAQIESLQAKLNDKDADAEKARDALQDSLKEKDQKIAELTKSVSDLQKQLSDAQAKAAKTAAAPAKAKPEPAPAPVAEAAPAEAPPAEEAPAKSKAVTARESTPVPTVKVTSWELKGAQPGKAVLASKTTGDIRNIEIGDNVEGLGQITVIGKENGRWTVRGTKGSVIR